MTPTIVLPDGDPHMAALLSRPDFAARLDRLGGARLHADLPKDDDELITRIGDATVVILGAYLTGPVLRRLQHPGEPGAHARRRRRQHCRRCCPALTQFLVNPQFFAIGKYAIEELTTDHYLSCR
jgi:hypothetical protein